MLDGDICWPITSKENYSCSVNEFNFDASTFLCWLDEDNETMKWESSDIGSSSEADPDHSPPSDTSTDSIVDNEIESMGILLEHNIVAGNFLATVDPIQPTRNETRSTRKANRNSGKAYTSAAGKLVPARKLTPLYACYRNCSNRISPELQEQIFTKYWELGSYNLRIEFISRLITVQNKKTTRNVKSLCSPRNRQYSYVYHLDDVDGRRIQVCQKCFKSSLGETDRLLRTVIAKKVMHSAGGGSAFIAKDLRGKSTPTNKFSAEKIQEALDHIRSFPTYESHYVRKLSTKKYLQSDLNLTIMHRLYRQQVVDPISLSKYSEIFKTIGLEFKKPKFDTCTICETVKKKIGEAKSDEINGLRWEQKQHLNNVDFACAAKKKDIEQSSGNVKVFSFGAQKCLPTPHWMASDAFHTRRPLLTFNLTIHDCDSGQFNHLIGILK